MPRKSVAILPEQRQRRCKSAFAEAAGLAQEPVKPVPFRRVPSDPLVNRGIARQGGKVCGMWTRAQARAAPVRSMPGRAGQAALLADDGINTPFGLRKQASVTSDTSL
jgi:hypothetical protein